MKPERVQQIADKHFASFSTLAKRGFDMPAPQWVLAAISEAVAETIEECAKVCVEVDMNDEEDDATDAVFRCVAAIRALARGNK